MKNLKESIIESLKKTIEDLNKNFEKYEKYMMERINIAKNFIQTSYIFSKQENFKFEILHNLKFLKEISIGIPNVNNFEEASIKAEKLISFFKLSF